MQDIDSELDKHIKDRESTAKTYYCINGHEVVVTKAVVKPSGSGKSFITQCPECQHTIRVRKDDVARMYGLNPRDSAGIEKLLEHLVAKQRAFLGDAVVATPPLPSPPPPPPPPPQPAHQVAEDEGDDEYDDDDGAEDDVDRGDGDDYDDSDGDDPEYVAYIEESDVEDDNGDKIWRYRISADDSVPDPDADPDGGHVAELPETDVAPAPNRSQTPKKRVSRQPPQRSVNAHGRRSDMDANARSYNRQKNAPARPRRRMLDIDPAFFADDETDIDPNDLLKQILEEAVDENTYARIASYIDLQPQGWQPAQIQGVLQLYLTPGAAQKISSRYQAELFRVEQEKRRKDQILNMLPQASTGFSLNQRSPAMPIPPITPPAGVPYGVFEQQPGAGVDYQPPYPPHPPPAAPPGYGGAPTYPYNPYAQIQYQSSFSGIRSRDAMSRAEVREIVESSLEERFRHLEDMISRAKADDQRASETAMMYQLVTTLLEKQMAQPGPASDPKIDTLMQSQNDLFRTLVMAQLERPKDDPGTSALLRRLDDIEVELKKKDVDGVGSDLPPLMTTVDELKQRIHLQQLHNELEISQQEFADKREGRQFAKEIAEHALTRIGQSIATAYLEGQPTAQGNAEHPPGTPLPPPSPSPTHPPNVSREARPEQPNPDPPTRAAPPQGGVPSGQTRVYGEVRDGKHRVPCPTCSSMMEIPLGASQAICPRCRQSYSIKAEANANIDPPRESV